MNIKYNIAVNTVNAALKVYAHCLPATVSRKFPEFVKGRVGLVRRIAAEMNESQSDAPVVWFHASSLGEFAIARPLITRLKAAGNVRIVQTFFSPSGYRVMKDRHPGIDHVFYLPLDTRANVRGFLEAVNPKAAVFLVSEYWPNMLQELKFRSVPTFLVSALIRNNAPFFRWYGKIFRKALLTYRKFFVLDHNSFINLRSLGCDNVEISGDPLFDNAALVASTDWTDPVMERFSENRCAKIFMAGSLSDRTDLHLVADALRDHPGLKAVIVPHDVTPKSIAAIENAIDGPVARYSQLTPESDLGNLRTIIVDCVGKLAYMYRYASMAYVGGGFTPLLHSVIEATVYGLPVSFGPRIERKITPNQLIERGIGAIVETPAELSQWIASMTPARLDETREKALAYVSENVGATARIVESIESCLWEKK